MRTVIILAVCLVSSGIANGDLMLGPQVFVEQAVEAHGGSTAILKYQTEVIKFKGTMTVDDKEVPLDGERIVQLPQQFKEIVRFKEGKVDLEMVTVINGEKGWQSFADMTKELSKSAIENQRAILNSYQTAQLVGLTDDKAIQLKNLNLGMNPSRIDGQSAWGIRVSREGQRDVDLYIADKTKLLLKIERAVADLDPNAEPGKMLKQEEMLTDYREVNGVKRPLKRILYVDGKKVMEINVTEINLVEQVDEKEFAKP